MIGGNLKATIQVKTTTKEKSGEMVKTWKDAQTIKGWLDLATGSSGYTAYAAKVQESTHIFIADYVHLAEGIRAESCSMTINGKRYDVMLIDNPMELNKQLEIYLKYTGGI